MNCQKGIVTLIRYRSIVVLLREAKPLKIFMATIGESPQARSVRRHIIWNNLRPDLKEDLAHLVQDIKRRICGIAGAGSLSFSI